MIVVADNLRITLPIEPRRLCPSVAKGRSDEAGKAFYGSVKKSNKGGISRG